MEGQAASARRELPDICAGLQFPQSGARAEAFSLLFDKINSSALNESVLWYTYFDIVMPSGKKPFKTGRKGEQNGYENDEQRINKYGISSAGMQVCTKNL